MGYALITSEIGDGRYTVELDWGQANKNALLDGLNILIPNLQIKLIQAESNLNDAEDAEDAARAAIAAAVQDIINIGVDDPEMSTVVGKAALQVFDDLQKQYVRLIAANQPLRTAVSKLKLNISNAQRQLVRWTNFIAVEQRGAWCADYTEGASGYVATIDVPGESDLVLLAPGCRGWAESDGVLSAREFLSPEQSFYNVSLLPGWQKFLPTYRWGSLVGIDRDANTGTVALAEALSSAQRLDVNQAAVLTAPFSYMDCDNAAFDVADNVIVSFTGQNWANPVIVGFLDNPKSCIDWPLVTMNFQFSVVNGNPTTLPWIGWFGEEECGYATAGYEPTRTTTSGQTWTGSYIGAPSLVALPPGSDFVITGTVIPPPVEVGYFSFMPSQSLDFSAPNGNSPGTHFLFTLDGPSITLTQRSYAFSNRNGIEWYTENEECRVAAVYSGNTWNAQESGKYPYVSVNNGVLFYTTQELYSGPAQGYFGQPTITVKTGNTSKQYELISMTQHPTLPTRGICTFRKAR